MGKSESQALCGLERNGIDQSHFPDCRGREEIWKQRDRTKKKKKKDEILVSNLEFMRNKGLLE